MLRILEVVESHKPVGSSAAQVALAWILAAVPNSVALVGIKRPAQLEDALGALSITLRPETVAALDAASIAVV